MQIHICKVGEKSFALKIPNIRVKIFTQSFVTSIFFWYNSILIYSRNTADLLFQGTNLFFLSLASVTLVSVLVLALILLSISIKTQQFAEKLSFSIMSYVGVTSCFLPVTGRVVLGSDNQAYEVNYWIMALVILFIYIFVFIYQSESNRKVFTRFIILTFLFITYESTIALAKIIEPTNYSSPLAASLATQISNKSNLLVISFDGISSKAVQEAFIQEPELQRVFQDFTLFDNAISTSPATTASTISSLFGNLDYKRIAKTEAQLIANLNANILPSYKVLNSFTYGSYNDFAPPEAQVPIGGFSYISLQNKNILQYLILSLSRSIPPKITDKFYSLEVFGAGKDGFLFPAEILESMPAWKRSLIPSFNDYNSFVRDLDVNDEEFALRQFHFYHSHYPINFQANCNPIGVGPTWYSSQEFQNFSMLVEETKCFLGQWGNLIVKLKQLGVYDSSTIIFKSDHGKPVGYFTEGNSALTINKSIYWGVDRYLPILMTKLAGQHSEEMQRNSKFVTLADLASTVCGLIPDFELNCNQFKGESIFVDSGTPRQFYLQVVESRNSTFRYDDHKTVVGFSQAGSLLPLLLADTSLVIGLPVPEDNMFSPR